MSPDQSSPVEVASPAPYAQVPLWLLPHGPNLVAVFASIASFANWHDGGCWPSLERIADRAGVSVSTVKRATRELVSLGALEVTRNRRRGDRTPLPNLYDVRPAFMGSHVTSTPRGGTGPTGQGVQVPENHEREPLNEKTDSPAESPGRDSAEGCTEQVAELCSLIAEHVAWTTERAAPTVTNGWRRSVRLMLERDDWTEEQVRFVLGWFRGGTRDAIFWRKNVLSADTLRRQMPKLRAAILAERDMAAVTPAPVATLTPDFMDGYVEDGLDPFTSALEKVRREIREREGQTA